jgi:hypothetical protein
MIVAFMSFMCGLILDTVVHGRREVIWGATAPAASASGLVGPGKVANGLVKSTPAVGADARFALGSSPAALAPQC